MIDFKYESEKKEAANKLQNSDRFELIEIRNFLTPQECVRMISYAEDNDLRPSLTDGGVTTSRTSSQTWIDRYSSKCDVQDIIDKIHDQSKLVTGQGDEAHYESLQLVRYRKGEQFTAHKDGHGRQYTVNIYLNDDFTGGETAFPRLRSSVKPEMGKAVIWRNMTPEGRIESSSEHRGCPILSGKKYICTQWIKYTDFFSKKTKVTSGKKQTSDMRTKLISICK